MELITDGKRCELNIQLGNVTYCDCDPNDVSDFPDFVFKFGDVMLTYEA